MLKRLLLTILLLAAPALAQKPAAVAPAGTPLARLSAMPAQLGSYQRGNLTDFAVTARDPRLGAALGYRSPQGSVGTVYLYDAGRTDIASGGRALVDEQLQSAIADVRQGGQQRGYSVVAEQAASVQGMRCVLFGLRHPQSAPIETGLCVGTSGGLFLKLRLTVGPSAQGMLVEELTTFVRGAGAALD